MKTEIADRLKTDNVDKIGPHVVVLVLYNKITTKNRSKLKMML